MKRVLVPLTLSLPPADAQACTAVLHTLSGETMGTSWSVKLATPAQPDLPQVRRSIQQQLDLVVAQMSTWEPRSDLSCFNRETPGSWRVLPPELFEVLEYALSIARDSGGAYDPTAGRLVNLWGFGPEPRPAIPPAAEIIEDARALAGWHRLKIEPQLRRVQQPGGIYIDLSAVAKGYAVDRVARYLASRGIGNHLVEVGGELRGSGVKPDGGPWWVALERPPRDDGAARPVTETIVALHGLSIATSGDYLRFFENGGARYSHTIDPRTGCPIPRRLASVTVLHRDCMAADALSTALTVLGADEGMAYATRRNLAALFIERGEHAFAERMTPAFAAMLE